MATRTATKSTADTKAKSSAKSKAKSSAKSKARSSAKSKAWRSRAVQRLVEPGSMVDCSHCGERVKFQAKMRHEQVICNVYVKNVWDRVEHFHAPCYVEADQPFGPPVD
ncbi:MAG: hypothetical protein OEW42_12770 [Acidimicrobiia bacterium]|nr:hypothetical protein [Acidimicrobiia bacterium]